MMQNIDTLLPGLAANHLWQVMALAALVWLGLKVQSRASAEVRSWLWLAVFMLAAVLPFASLLPGDGISPLPAIMAPVETANIDVISGSQQPVVPAAVEAKSTIWPMVKYALIALWIVGLIWGLYRLCHAYLLSRWLVLNSTRLPRGHSVIPDHWPGHAPVHISSALAGPLVIGMIRPTILIPKSYLTTMQTNEIHRLLDHELAHIDRGDIRMAVLQRLVLAVFWWSPVMYWLDRQISLTREMACDERAARRGGSTKAYASALLKGARHIALGGQVPLAMGVYEKNTLKARIQGLMASEACAHRLSPVTRPIIVGLLFLAGIAVVIGWVTPRIAPPAFAETDISDDSENENKGRRLGHYLVEAVMKNDRATVTDFIAAGADINYARRGDGTALIIAARRGDRTMVEFLVSKGADVNKPSRGDGNPLIMASMVGHQDVVHYLVEQGADVNALVRGDETPLINAARRGHLDIVKYLVDAGADVNFGVDAPTSFLGTEWRSPLSMARKGGHRDVVDYLTNRGAVK